MKKQKEFINSQLNEEAMLKAIVEKSPNIIFVRQGSRIIYANNRSVEMLGYGKDEIYADDFDFMKMVHRDSHTIVLDNYQRHLNGKEVAPYELKLVTKSRKELTAIHSSKLIDLGEEKAILGIFTNITDHKRVEDALRESEQKYRNLVEKANDAIFLADNETGLIIDANQKAEEMLGIPLEEIIGMHQSNLHPAEELEKYKEIFRKHVENGEGRAHDLLVINSHGQSIPVDISSSTIEIGGEKVIQGIFRDVSERKQSEEELIKYHQRLEDRVQESTHELLEANKKLKSQIQVRKQAEKQLLAHQKQLSSLSSQLSLIEENEKRRIATELHDCIGQTLALSKIKLGILKKSVPAEEPREIIKEIQHLLEQTIRETRTLTFELSPPILYELGLSQAIKWLIDQFRDKHDLDMTLNDDGREKPFDNNTRFFLFQAVRELLVNIVKHANASRVKISLSEKKGKLNLVVEDNGIGFTGSPVNCEGYGLFNIRERMNHINGQFNIKSIPGKGTRVALEAQLMPSGNP